MATAKKNPGTATASPAKRAPARKAASAPATVKASAPVPATAKAAKPVVKPAAKPAEKARKPKLVRDSFTIPKAEYVVIEALKQRAAKAGSPVKKSELLRAGLKALAAMGDQAFATALAAVPAIKTGRPAKG
ncbi:MAG: hypothetical protein H7255_18780 [Ramlibacter sp.]|nr:hypothetical protein [Ramlibacter sp.]